MPGKPVIYSKKVCLLGTFGVGKTSLVRRFVHNLFEDKYLSTIGVQIYQKEMSGGMRDGLKMVIWDLANIEKFSSATRNYFQGASGAIVVFDVTRPESYTLANVYLDQFLEINSKASLVFASNKTDLMDADFSAPDVLKEAAAKYRSPYYLTSAKTAGNVEDLFKTLSKKLLEHT